MSKAQRPLAFWPRCSSSCLLSLCGDHSMPCGSARRKTHGLPRPRPEALLKNESPPESRWAFLFSSFLVSRINADRAEPAWVTPALPAVPLILSFSLSFFLPVSPLPRLYGPRRATRDFRWSCPPQLLVPSPAERACQFPRECPAAFFC